MPDFDTSVPHIARVYDYWLGGKDNFPVDRETGGRMAELNPSLPRLVRDNRRFLCDAAARAAGDGVDQFLDLGAGLPAHPAVHEAVRKVHPGARVCYVDNDPAVLVHARALLQTPMLASTPEGTVSYVDADLRDVTAVLAGLARTLDLERPVALIMLGVLGHLDDHGAARSITSQLMDALPSGSYLAIADGVADPGPVSEAQRRYNDAAPVRYHLRRPDELASFFDGLDLIEPGVVPCPRWKPDASGHGASEESHAYCGVARKR